MSSELREEKNVNLGSLRICGWTTGHSQGSYGGIEDVVSTEVFAGGIVSLGIEGSHSLNLEKKGDSRAIVFNGE